MLAPARSADATFWGMPLWLAVSVSVLIIFGRGQAYYWIGRGLGPRLYTSRLGRRIGEERLRRVERLVRTRGWVAVLGSHWVAGIRHAIPVSAGVVRMSYAWYLLATALGALLWTPPWVVGGYAVVWGWLQVAARSPVIAAALAVAAAALIAALVTVRTRRRRPASTAGRSSTPGPG
jgi:membrane-associated protein